MLERAEKVARNDRKIMDAMAELWLEVPLSELTLDRVSQRSGVTVRTILRKFGSKESLFNACIENAGDRFTQRRMQATPGDLTEILDVLLEEYEFPSTQKLLKKARTIHREWCAMAFEPFLPLKSSDRYEIVLSAFIAATEFYLWKLLRRDLGRSPEQCRQIFTLSLESLAVHARN